MLRSILIAVALSLSLSATAAAAVAPQQTTATLLASVTAYSTANGTHRVMRVPAQQSVTDTATVLPVLSDKFIGAHQWLHVRLNGRHVHSGWIQSDAVQLGSTSWHVRVSLQGRRVSVYRSGKLVHSNRVVIGKRSTPTPGGKFYIVKKVHEPSSSILGPWVLYTSAWGKVATGGIGLEVALHGRRGLMGDPLGSARSHGCVRMNDSEATWLAKRLPLGTPVDIL